MWSRSSRVTRAAVLSPGGDDENDERTGMDTNLAIPFRPTNMPSTQTLAYRRGGRGRYSRPRAYGGGCGMINFNASGAGMGLEDEEGEEGIKQRTSTPTKTADINSLAAGAGDASTIAFDGHDMYDISSMTSVSTSSLLMDQELSSILELGSINGNGSGQEHDSREMGQGDFQSPRDGGILKKKIPVGSSCPETEKSRANRSVTFVSKPEIIEGEKDVSKYFEHDPEGSDSEDVSRESDDDDLEVDIWSSKETRLLLLGYGIAVFVLLGDKAQWIVDEVLLQGEGHSVSKMAVVLLLLYTFSFINWGLEGLRVGDCILELVFPLWSYRLRLWFENNLVDLTSYPKLLWIRYAKILIPSLFAKVGLVYWNTIWKDYVCKSHYDTSCTATLLGNWLYGYRNVACHDGLASSIVCERFLSYLPLILATGFVSVFGNVICPLICDYMENFLMKVKQDVNNENLNKLSKLLQNVQDQKENQTKAELKQVGTGTVRPHAEVTNASIYEVSGELESNSSDFNSVDEAFGSDATLNVGFLDQTENSVGERKSNNSGATATKN